jgi:hypothetical protein
VDPDLPAVPHIVQAHHSTNLAVFTFHQDIFGTQPGPAFAFRKTFGIHHRRERTVTAAGVDEVGDFLPVMRACLWQPFAGKGEQGGTQEAAAVFVNRQSVASAFEDAAGTEILLEHGRPGDLRRILRLHRITSFEGVAQEQAAAMPLLRMNAEIRAIGDIRLFSVPPGALQEPRSASRPVQPHRVVSDHIHIGAKKRRLAFERHADAAGQGRFAQQAPQGGIVAKLRRTNIVAFPAHEFVSTKWPRKCRSHPSWLLRAGLFAVPGRPPSARTRLRQAARPSSCT